MGVNHRRRHILMAEQFLNRADVVTRSLLTLPSRIMISRRVNATSFTRKRSPVPYNKLTIRFIVHEVPSSNCRTSVGVSTTGKRLDGFAAITSSSHGNSTANTFDKGEARKTRHSCVGGNPALLIFLGSRIRGNDESRLFRGAQRNNKVDLA
jgi:hypothetical protein